MERKVVSVILALSMLFGTATFALAQDKMNENAKRQFIADVAKLDLFMMLDGEGFFRLSAQSAEEVGIPSQTYSAVATQFREINTELEKMSKDERFEMFRSGLDSRGEEDNQIQWCIPVYMPK